MPRIRIKIHRNEIQIQRNKIKGRRNKIKMHFVAGNSAISDAYVPIGKIRRNPLKSLNSWKEKLGICFLFLGIPFHFL